MRATVGQLHRSFDTGGLNKGKAGQRIGPAIIGPPLPLTVLELVTGLPGLTMAGPRPPIQSRHLAMNLAPSSGLSGILPP